MLALAECPAGHELARWKNRCSTLKCDGGCNKPLVQGEFRWSCTLCDYDTCQTCYDEAAQWQVPLRSVLRTTAEKTSEPPPTPAEVLKASTAKRDAAKAAKATATPVLPAAGDTATPAVVTAPAATAASSWIYASHNLASVKRDLSSITASASLPRTKQACVRPSPLAPSSPSAGLDADSRAIAATGADGFPDLAEFGLKPNALVRLSTRREWLHQLHQCELQRVHRAAEGAPRSDFEVACGLAQSTPLTARQTNESLAAVNAKFEAERTALREAEQMEIEAMQAMGTAACVAYE